MANGDQDMATAELMATEGLKVLAVDDDPVYLQTLTQMLRRCGYQGTSSGPLILDLLATVCPLCSDRRPPPCSDGQRLARRCAERGGEEPGRDRLHHDGRADPGARDGRLGPPQAHRETLPRRPR